MGCWQAWHARRRQTGCKCLRTLRTGGTTKTAIATPSGAQCSISRVFVMDLGVHNMLLRNAIRNYKAFEVKTQRDSFMIALHDPVSTVSCRFEIQQRLLEVDWHPNLLKLASCC